MRRRAFLTQLAALTTATASVSFPAAATGTQRAGPTGRRVLVLGAGAAGLAAALALIERGHSVRVLEAQSRPGGRVLTLREGFADGLYAEAGAFWIPGDDAATLDYAGRFGLTLAPIPAAALTTQYFLRGRRYSLAHGEEPAWPYDLRPEERTLGLAGLLQRYLGPGIAQLGDLSAPNWPPPALAGLDAQNLGAYLAAQGASAGAISLLRQGYADLFGEGIDSYSALLLLRDAAMSDSRDFYRIVGGNAALTEVMAKELGAAIRYGAAVRAIRQREAGVEVWFTQGGEMAQETADGVLCTLPAPALRRVEIDPPWPADKRQALAALPQTACTRLFMQFGERIWRERGIDGYCITDTPLGMVGDATYGVPGRRGVLECYLTGPRAQAMAGLDETAALTRALHLLRPLLPDAPAHYEGGRVFSWAEQPWAGGAYAWFRPGQMQSLLPVLRRPEGRVHFAGDHLSARPGWLAGAFASAQTAAAAVHAEIIRDFPLAS